MRFGEVYKPQVGDTRVVIKFAWFPKVVEGRRIWLEKYKSAETFVCLSSYTSGSYYNSWEERDTCLIENDFKGVE